MERKKSSGHTEYLRAVLKQARTERGWSTQTVADKIAAELGEERMSGETVRLYEQMRHNPPIDKFAAWARVLGYRLIVDLDRAEHERISVRLHHDDAAEIARIADGMSKGRRARLLAYLRDENTAEDAE